jgi:hypothetical protein
MPATGELIPFPLHIGSSSSKLPGSGSTTVSRAVQSAPQIKAAEFANLGVTVNHCGT